MNIGASLFKCKGKHGGRRFFHYSKELPKRIETSAFPRSPASLFPAAAPGGGLVEFFQGMVVGGGPLTSYCGATPKPDQNSKYYLGHIYAEHRRFVEALASPKCALGVL